MKVYDIDRSKIRGSFVVAVYGNVGNQRVLLGVEAVLSRWNIDNCANCQRHLKVTTFTPVGPAAHAGLLAALSEDDLVDKGSYHVNLHTHDGVIEYGSAAVQADLEGIVVADAVVEQQPAFDFEIV